MKLSNFTNALFLIASSLVTTGLKAQNDLKQAPVCPGAADLRPAHFYGRWQAELEGMPAASSTLLLGRDLELPDSFSGHLLRAGVSVQVAGDVDEGALTLEESLDGQHISATWLGELVPTSCGREFRGSWSSVEQPTPQAFVLRKVPSWD